MVAPLLFVVGTRPEGIKLIPLFKRFKSKGYPVLLCATQQHRQMLDEVCSVFNVVPDFNLNIMKDNQDLFYVTSAVLQEVKTVLQQIKPSLVFVHGDTTTTFATALAAFYQNIPVAHVEAGLRTGDMQHPFPEEMNRRFVAQLAHFNFAPTPFSTAHLLSEGIEAQKIFCVGNTIVDALHEVQALIQGDPALVSQEIRTLVEACKKKYKRLFLVTAHRRESYGQGLENVFTALSTFALQNGSGVCFIHPVHPNPAVKSALDKTDFHKQLNVFPVKPLSYVDMVYLLNALDYIVTDSGGLQEEGSALGKPVVCLRDVTERNEGVWEGLEVLAGTDPQKIIASCQSIMQRSTSSPSTVYGDGHTVDRIVKIIESQWLEKNQKKIPLSNDRYKEKQV